MNILPPVHKETCKKKSLNNRTLIFVSKLSSCRKDQNRILVLYLTPEVFLSMKLQDVSNFLSITTGFDADHDNTKNSLSNRNFWKAKGNACSPALLSVTLKLYVFSTDKASNNWYLENKSTSVRAGQRQSGSGNSLRLCFGIIYAVTLLAQVLSEFWLVLRNVLPSNTGVCVGWELLLLAKSLYMNYLFWVQEVGSADRNSAVSAGLEVKKQSICHSIC